MRHLRTYIRLGIVVLLCGTVQSSYAQLAKRGVEVVNVKSYYRGETLQLDLDVRATRLNIDCDGQVILQLAVEARDRRLVLPVVVYASNSRYRYEQRRKLLSDEFDVEPYHIYKGVKETNAYKLDYVLSIPYYPWMEQARLVFAEYLQDCKGERLVTSGVLSNVLGQNIDYTAPPVAVPVVQREQSVVQSPAVEQSVPLLTVRKSALEEIPTEALKEAPQEVPKEAFDTAQVTYIPVVVPRTPDRSLVPELIHLIEPPIEAVKARASAIELPIGFPVGGTEVLPDFGNNPRELARADSLVGAVQGNELLEIDGITIRGYASPEGGYQNNERLARERANGFKRYLVNNYPGDGHIRNARVDWVAEDWDGVARLVRQSAISHKEMVLDIALDERMDPDDRIRALQEIEPWSEVYGPMLRQMFPRLRRIELRIDYTVGQLDQADAGEWIDKDPALLSLSEIYRAAREHEPGSERHRELHLIAARTFPDDPVANNNAAAVLLLAGDTEGAWTLLEKCGNSAAALINRGVCFYLRGEMEQAFECFEQAHRAGLEQGRSNRQRINGGLAPKEGRP